MAQDDPIRPMIVKSVLENMSLSNREEFKRLIDDSMRPDPQQQQLAQATAQTQLEFTQSQTQALIGQATESQARAKKIQAETVAIPIKEETDRIEAIADMTRADGEISRDEFNKKLKIAETSIKERATR